MSKKSESTKTSTSKQTKTAAASESTSKVETKEHSKKLTMSKRKYFVPATGKVYEAESVSDASEKAQKELKKESKK